MVDSIRHLSLLISVKLHKSRQSNSPCPSALPLMQFRSCGRRDLPQLVCTQCKHSTGSWPQNILPFFSLFLLLVVAPSPRDSYAWIVPSNKHLVIYDLVTGVVFFNNDTCKVGRMAEPTE
ncbi:Ephrin Type-A Receptor 1, partial [Manis pentadactyla]